MGLNAIWISAYPEKTQTEGLNLLGLCDWTEQV